MYFISFQILVGFIVQNLFILVIIQSLEYAGDDDFNEKLMENIEDFKMNWLLLSNKNCHYKLNEKSLLSFFKKLKKPFGS